jgi:hypothetical protein
MFMDGYKNTSSDDGSGESRNDEEQVSDPPLNRLPSRHLPFAFGTLVYHRARAQKIRGIVTSYMFSHSAYAVGVTWDTGLEEHFHRAFELSEVFTPDYVSDDEGEVEESCA